MPEDIPVSPLRFTLSGGYPYQSVTSVTAPTYSTALTMGYGEIFTEARIRQIIREELVAYFDEGKDVLSVSADLADITQEMRDSFDALQKSWSLPFPEDDTQS